MAKEKFDQVHKNFATCQPSAAPTPVAAFAEAEDEDAQPAEDDKVEIAALNARIAVLQKKKEGAPWLPGAQRRQGAPVDRKPRACHHCGRTNHFIKDCRDRINGKPSVHQQQQQSQQQQQQKKPSKPSQKRSERVSAVDDGDTTSEEEDDRSSKHVNVAMLNDLSRRFAHVAERAERRQQQQQQPSGN